MTHTHGAGEGKLQAARASVISAVFLTIMKAVVGLLTGSLGIIAEALHSLLDLGAACMTWFSVGYSERPADSSHHYGHGKIENLSALTETLLLLLTCFWVAWEAVERLVGVHKTSVEANVWGLGVMATSIGIDWYRSRRLYRAARQHKSQALEADALHFSSDILSSAVVIIGLLGVRMGYPKADAMSAMFVSVWVVGISVRLGVRAIQELLDAAPANAREEIASAVGGVNGVEQVSKVRVRQSGPLAFADVNVKIDGSLTLHEVHRLLDHAEEAISAKLPGIDVVVHAEPLESQAEDPEILVKVSAALRALTSERGLRFHHARVIEEDEGLVALVCIAFPSTVPLCEARDQADQIEKEVLHRVPVLRDVVAHIDVIEEEVAPVCELPVAPEASAVEAHVLSLPGVSGCHELKITPWPPRAKGQPAVRVDGYLVSLHVSVPSQTTVAQSHEIASKVEESLLEHFPQVQRVHVHQEAERVASLKQQG